MLSKHCFRHIDLPARNEKSFQQKLSRHMKMLILQFFFCKYLVPRQKTSGSIFTPPPRHFVAQVSRCVGQVSGPTTFCPHFLNCYHIEVSDCICRVWTTHAHPLHSPVTQILLGWRRHFVLMYHKPDHWISTLDVIISSTKGPLDQMFDQLVLSML